MKSVFTKEAKIGLVTIVSLALLYLGINYLKGINLFQPVNHYYVSFSNVKGVTISSPVFVDGFKVGLVRDIIYDYDTTGSSITASRVEQKVTGALMSVTSQEKTRIMVLDGYQDTEPSSLTTLLEGNQYEIIRRSLLTEELDDNASAAILFAPQNDLEEDSIRKNISMA